MSRDRLRERLLSKAVIDMETGCWIWTARRNEKGYGRVSVNRVPIGAHRAVYQLLVGPIPPGMQLDHLCHGEDASCEGGVICPHRACVNPAHLEPVTQQENNRRSKSPSALNARKTHCAYGHLLAGANVVASGPDGRGRRCIRCRSDWIEWRRIRNAAKSAPSDLTAEGANQSPTPHAEGPCPPARTTPEEE